MPPAVLIVLLILGAILVFALAGVFVQWMKARVNGARIGFFALIRMYARNVNVNMVLHAVVLATRGGVTVTPRQLETHYRGGGNPVTLVMALVAADAAQLHVTYEELAEINLRGEDPVAHVKRRAEAR